MPVSPIDMKNLSSKIQKYQKYLEIADMTSELGGNQNGYLDTQEEVDAAVALCKEEGEDYEGLRSYLQIVEVDPALITWQPAVKEEMNTPDDSDWQKANWSNGDPFNCAWQPDNVTFGQGKMLLTLDNKGCPQECEGKPYASGEFRSTQEKYGFGYYEVRMKPAKGDGLVSSFFTYTGTYGQSDHHEIDFEFLGKDTNKVQLNYYVEGQGNHEVMIDLGFDASKEFHNYGFKLTPDSLTWYVDGKPVHTVKGKVPSKPGKIMVNFWPGTGVDGWLKAFNYSGKPLSAEYDWIAYAPLDGAKQTIIEQPVAEKPVVVAPAVVVAKTGSLSVNDIQQGSFSFNEGSVSSENGIYTFSARSAKDPGFGIVTGNKDIEGSQTLKFDIKGQLTKEGGYARLIVQVYDDGDDDYTPSVSLDPIPLTADFKTMTLKLAGKVDKVKKVQVLLVTDKGSCKVEVKNIRFE